MKNIRSMMIWLSVMLAVIGIWLISRILDSADPPVGLYVLCSSAFTLSIICFGWWITLKQAARQNSLRLIVESRLSEAYQKRVEALRAVYPKELTIPVEDLESEDPKKIDAINGAIYLLNYFELMAESIMNGDLEDGIVKHFFQAIIPILCKKSKYVIQDLQAREPSALENLLQLAETWSQK